VPTRISRQDLYRRITDGDRPILVEALGAGYFTDAHLPGAINIPQAHVDRLAPKRLPDRQAPIIVYCTGTGASSTAVARRLEELGYTAVAVYGGGKEDWVEHGLPVERLDTELDPAHAAHDAQGPSQTGARRAAFAGEQHALKPTEKP
jgi:rhodanese-related sulfurtransferase